MKRHEERETGNRPEMIQAAEISRLNDGAQNDEIDAERYLKDSDGTRFKQLEQTYKPSSGDETTRAASSAENMLIPKKQTCHACNLSLSMSPELICVAGQSQMWHPGCFKCAICNAPMDRYQSCHLFREQVVCSADYMKLKLNHLSRDTTKCARCRETISSTVWVRKAADFVYHLVCFNCDICSRQLNTGDQFMLKTRHNNVKLLCRYHFTWSNQDAKAEQGCNMRRVSRVGPTAGHKRVVSSSHRQPLGAPENDQFMAKQQAACFSHSLDRNSASPPPEVGCHGDDDGTAGQRNLLMIDTTTKSMPISSQSADLSSSPPALSIHETEHYSRPHNMGSHQLGSTSGSSVSTTPSLSSSPPSMITHQVPISHLQLASSSASSSSLMMLQQTNSNSASSSSAVSNACMAANSAASKSKRVRTTFTDDQLKILQEHFSRDSNPDGQDLERIATITGLSKRVTQVWFQNSRARDKKKHFVKKKSTDLAHHLSHSHLIHHQHNHHNQPQQPNEDGMYVLNDSIQAQSQPASAGIIGSEREGSLIKLNSQISNIENQYPHSRNALHNQAAMNDEDTIDNDSDRLD